MFNDPTIYRTAGRYAGLFERLHNQDQARAERAFYLAMRTYERTDADRQAADLAYRAGLAESLQEQTP